MPQPQDDDAKFNWPRWFDWGLRLFLALIFIANSLLLIDFIALDLGVLHRAPQQLALRAEDPSTPDGWIRFASVDPQGWLGKAGLRAGDTIRYDGPLDHQRVRIAGETVGFTLDRGGTISHHTYTIPQGSDNAGSNQRRAAHITTDLVSLLVGVFGVFVLFRRWRDRTATTLVLTLFGFSTNWIMLPHWLTDPALGFLVLALQAAGVWLITFGPAFCLSLLKVAPSRNWAVLALSLPALAAMIVGVTYYSYTTLRWFPGIGLLSLGFPLVFLLEALLVGWILLRGLGQADAAGRNRIKLVLATFVLYLIGVVLNEVFLTGSLTGNPLLALIGWSVILLYSLPPFMLVYVVLRHKLFDFSFAVNRALVYGFVSALILIGIGLSEWAAKKLVPPSWHEASAFYSAAIALGLFLLFHRIHHWVEHHVEHLFFRDWQTNEARLRQFIEAASHYERQDSLMRDTVAELRRFTASDEAALLWRQGGEDYVCLHGALAVPLERIDADDPAVARARVVRGPVAVDETGSALPASLILPVIDHGQIVGLVLLGAKPNSLGYRPDEVEVMAWAVQQAGLDLQSMRARALEAKVSTLEAQVERLSAILADRPANA